MNQIISMAHTPIPGEIQKELLDHTRCAFTAAYAHLGCTMEVVAADSRVNETRLIQTESGWFLALGVFHLGECNDVRLRSLGLLSGGNFSPISATQHISYEEISE